MDLRNNSSSGTYNLSASGSEASSNTSPSSRTSQLPMGKEADSQASGSGQGTPNQTRIPQPRTLSPAKGGCWTCRLRRKKCEEQREEEGGACETCRRLQIECLGWGSKRPEWMKDKKAQDEYKARIKATLLSNNIIRVQQRTYVPSNAQSLPSPPVVPSQSYSSWTPVSLPPEQPPEPLFFLIDLVPVEGSPNAISDGYPQPRSLSVDLHPQGNQLNV